MLIADLHIHSKFSRACSKDLNLENLEKYARIKGIGLLGTGDFTHPKWFGEIKNNLCDDGNGVLWSKTKFPFVLQTEVSLIYSQGGKGRRVHNIILAPSFEVVKQISDWLGKKGRLDYDGRPIFNIPCPEFVEKLMSISRDIEVIPAHAWTPWFSVFGSMSGFDSVEECFKDQAKSIHALETGLSSDPAMNWRLSRLDKYALVSFSDSHSFWPWRLGREVTLFDIKELSYKNLINAIRTKERLFGTVETEPAYGKYHWDGHRICSVVMSPEESKKHNNICPVCGRGLTIGVDHRVGQLADRPLGFKPKDAKEFYSLIPLSEILAHFLKSGIASKKIWFEYNKLIHGRSEFDVLLKLSFDELKKIADEKIAEAIIKVREGKIRFNPGYDGVYGEPIFDEGEAKQVKIIERKQKTLSDF